MILILLPLLYAVSIIYDGCCLKLHKHYCQHNFVIIDPHVGFNTLEPYQQTQDVEAMLV